MSLTNDDRPAHLVGVVGVEGLAGLQHDVVGDIDGQADRTHSRPGDAIGDEAWGWCVRIQTGHRQGDELAAGIGLDVHANRTVNRADRLLAVGIREVHGHGMGHLAGNTANRHAVADVRSDVDVEDLFRHTENRQGILARNQLVSLDRWRQSDNTGVVDTDAQLIGGAEHAVRHVAVGPAGADGESAGKHRSGQGDDHPGAFDGVGSTTDDAASLDAILNVLGVSLGVVPGTDVNPAPVDGLAVLLRLGDRGQDVTDDDRAGQLATDDLDLLNGRGVVGEDLSHLLGGGAVRQVDHGLQP